ncbi:sensor histidine kinase [Paenibacillus frigoriresistens]|uniref:cache domain-containing sensor histidine kinase n=1 Tax=Paenibacillus alginolyticus TaxID=59839 RepID=UPI001563BC3F|nr:sensor histidine kinase [Paenibacillus frigoriresistens]NRF93586.1 sensor histidine kinase [Paenibacillus frigoriresistens]
MGRFIFQKRWSLTNKGIIVFSILILVPLVILSYYSYQIANYSLRKQAIASTETILDSTLAHMESLIAEVEDASTYAIYSDDIRYLMMDSEGKSFTNHKLIEEHVAAFFNFLLTSKQFIHSIQLKGMNGSVVEYGKAFSGAEAVWEQKAKEREGNFLWTQAYPNSFERNVRVFSLFRVINDKNDIANPIGMLRIRLNMESIKGIINKTTPAHVSGIDILDDQGESLTLANNTNDGSEELASQIRAYVKAKPELPSSTFRTDHGIYYVVQRNVQSTGGRLVAWIDQGDVLLETAFFSKYLHIIIAISFASVILASLLFYTKIISPILQLTKVMRRAKNEDWTTQAAVHSKDELGVLAETFNHMIHRIHTLIDKEYKLEIKQKEIEIRVLQTQIHPHFLYNTLDMIRWTARMEKALETGRLIETLSQLFRLSLNNGKTWVRVEEEMLYIRSYLELQQKRLGQRLSYTIQGDELCKRYYIPKMLLQPLIENCIVHGMPPSYEDELHIVITVQELEAGLWCIDIIDNGTGADPGCMVKVMSRNDEEHTGLRNVNERLRILFGPEFGLKFREVERGTCIRLMIPLLKEEDSSIIAGSEAS